MGWEPTLPSVWTAAGRVHRLDGHPHAVQASLEEARGRLRDKAWAAAQHHFGAADLGRSAPVFDAARAAAKIVAKCKDPLMNVAADAVVCGGGLALFRAAQPGFDDDGLLATHCATCHSCGQRLSARHAYADCPRLADLDDPSGILAATAWIFAPEAADLPDSVVFRGLIPRRLLPAAPRRGPFEPAEVALPAIPEGGWRGGYTDGAGPPGARRRGDPAVGAGAASLALDAQGRLAGVTVFYAAVPGRQTVPRAEAWAYDVLDRGMSAAGAPDDESIAVDASYVVNGLAKPATLARMVDGTNGDLWRPIAERAHRPARKVRSHLTPADVAAGRISLVDLFGNALADVAAGLGSGRFQAPPDEERRYRRVHAAAIAAVRRAAFIEASWYRAAPARVPLPPARPAAPPLAPLEAAEELLAAWRAAGHAPVSQRGAVTCAWCAATVAPAGAASLRFRACTRPAPPSGALPGGLAATAAAASPADDAFPPTPLLAAEAPADAEWGTRAQRKRRLEENAAARAAERAATKAARVDAAAVAAAAVPDRVAFDLGHRPRRPPLPAWLGRIAASSQHDLRLAGQWAFCTRCGGIDAGAVRGSPLLTRACDNACAAGSVARRDRLRAGQAPFAAFPCADGLGADHRRPLYRLVPVPGAAARGEAIPWRLAAAPEAPWRSAGASGVPLSFAASAPVAAAKRRGRPRGAASAAAGAAPQVVERRAAQAVTAPQPTLGAAPAVSAGERVRVTAPASPDGGPGVDRASPRLAARFAQN